MRVGPRSGSTAAGNTTRIAGLTKIALKAARRTFLGELTIAAGLLGEWLPYRG